MKKSNATFLVIFKPCDCVQFIRHSQKFTQKLNIIKIWWIAVYFSQCSKYAFLELCVVLGKTGHFSAHLALFYQYLFWFSALTWNFWTLHEIFGFLYLAWVFRPHMNFLDSWTSHEFVGLTFNFRTSHEFLDFANKTEFCLFFKPILGWDAQQFRCSAKLHRDDWLR